MFGAAYGNNSGGVGMHYRHGCRLAQVSKYLGNTAGRSMLGAAEVYNVVKGTLPKDSIQETLNKWMQYKTKINNRK